jgi:hypothetical protein
LCQQSAALSAIDGAGGVVYRMIVRDAPAPPTGESVPS